MSLLHLIYAVVCLRFCLCDNNSSGAQASSVAEEEGLAINAASPTELIFLVLSNAYQYMSALVFVRIFAHQLLQQKTVKGILA